VATTGCNDCHTVGYPESGGKVPEAEWLTGSPVGFAGPWGTTYPANLRLTAQALSEEAWMVRARSALRPPMPWFSLRDMSDSDLRAMYRYIRSLGAKGTMAPAYVAPGGKVTTPYIEFVPKNLPARAAAK
jgi:mono/diheme cytochrome c family protein